MTKNFDIRLRCAAIALIVTAPCLWPREGVAGMDGLTPQRAGDVVVTNVELGRTADSIQTVTIREADASSIKVHFGEVDLADGVTVTVADPDGLTSHSYPGAGSTSDQGSGFWALSVLGDTAVITMEGTASGLMDSSLVIDMYAWGYPLDPLYGPPLETVCGTDDRLDVVCYEQSHPIEFAQASASAHVRITTPQGTFVCTGWRVGEGPHMITNEHCVTSQADLDSTEFWFNWQRLNCGAGGSGPITIVGGDDFLVDSYVLDFALVTIDNPAAVEEFGFLELDVRTPELGEEIYIPGHPDGTLKRYALESDVNAGGLCVIDDAIRNGRGTNTDTGYFCDSSGGQSGSPVLARSTRKVIALHHFGTGTTPCGGNVMNAGVRIDRIWPLVESYLGPMFEDGFETGDASHWSSTVP